MRALILCLLLAACATPRPIDVLWEKVPGAATSGRMDGNLCRITTADKGEVDTAEFGAAFRSCLEART